MARRPDPSPGQPARIDVEREIDRLYQLDPKEFTGARRLLAARLEAAGNEAAGDRVRALAKPTLSAWAVNQLYWRARDTFDEMTTAGDRLRAAQRKLLMGGANRQLAALTDAREAAIAKALNAASAFVREAGHEPSQALGQRIGATLDVIATEGSRSAEPRGRWTSDLMPTGFGALAGLVPDAATPLRLVKAPAPDRDADRGEPERAIHREQTSRGGSAWAATRAGKAAERNAHLDRARAALAQAESELRSSRADVERAASAEKETADRLAAARADVDEARRRLDEATARADRLHESLQQARQRARDAATAVTAAEKAVSSARETLDKLT